MSSRAEMSYPFPPPAAPLEYRDIAAHQLPGSPNSLFDSVPTQAVEGKRAADLAFIEKEVEVRLARERADAALQFEERCRACRPALEQQAEGACMAKTIAGFDLERDTYFAHVEGEIVQLALAIAGKILHREAQVDPMLVAALVRIAVEKMREGSSVTVRVSPGQVKRWKDYFGMQVNMAGVEVLEDPELSDQDCLMQTELGVANFGLDTQLKEVEQGFFDLLALRPVNR